MEEQQIGWIAAIIVGGIAGWLAEQFMKSEMGLVMNIVLGIIGAAVASWLMGFFGISLGRRLDRLFDRRFYRSLHPHRGGPRLQRRVSANLKLGAAARHHSAMTHPWLVRHVKSGPVGSMGSPIMRPFGAQQESKLKS
jgi:uncharacterized membrane protein YeaQ/YmgE (transglycosylase-associated protein family)